MLDLLPNWHADVAVIVHAYAVWLNKAQHTIQVSIHMDLIGPRKSMQLGCREDGLADSAPCAGLLLNPAYWLT